MTAKPRRGRCEQVFVIAFKAKGRILDSLGAWADQLSQQLDQPHWRISESRVDITDSLDRQRATYTAFVEVKQLGLTILDPENGSKFSEQARRFLLASFNRPEFGSALWINRLGVRGRFCIPAGIAFEELVRRFQARYFDATSQLMAAMGEKVELIDCGAPLNFRDADGEFNTMCGPMKPDQMSQFFPGVPSDEFPEASIYFDVDCFQHPKASVKTTEVIATVQKLATKCWDRRTRVAELLLK